MKSSVFTPEEREYLRNDLIAQAEADPRITAAALVGSVAADREDRWSDIDLALRLAEGQNDTGVIEDWTRRFYEQHDAITHLDIRAAGALYRVFLLSNTLQIDISFWPFMEFGSTAPAFKLLFGEANTRPPSLPPQATQMIGMGWLYALHCRSALAREKTWQAEYMISEMRDQVLALACLRYGLPAFQARGVDELPSALLDLFTMSLVRSPYLDELRRAFTIIMELFLQEVALHDEQLALQLTPTLKQLLE